MFKVISKTNLIQSVPIIKNNGEESIACLPPRGEIYTRRITPALQYLIDNKQVLISETGEYPQKENLVESLTDKDSGTFSEHMNITEFNSQEEKEQIEELLVNEETAEEPLVEENVDKPKRSRKKKTDGGDN